MPNTSAPCSYKKSESSLCQSRHIIHQSILNTANIGAVAAAVRLYQFLINIYLLYIPFSLRSYKLVSSQHFSILGLLAKINRVSSTLNLIKGINYLWNFCYCNAISISIRLYLYIYSNRYAGQSAATHKSPHDLSRVV